MGCGKTICNSVLIDLDGTLVDTAPDIVEAAGRMLEDLSMKPLQFKTVAGFIGRGVPNLVRLTLEASGLEPSVEQYRAEALFHRHYRVLNGRFSGVFPGVPAGLAALRAGGYRLACVTNKPERLASQLLDLTGLANAFDVLVGGDTIAQMKPDPGPIHHACRMLESGVAGSVMVGDSGVDVAAARAAGIPVFIMRYGYAGPGGPESLGCDGVLGSLEDLPDFLTWGNPLTASRHNNLRRN
ncbi:phosphoglycolate phosphatase [Pandoraea terrae]|uniref:Phosphoglycolate phosphatase n=1 Tax=Pandoraea terrae TaxID=1537710 RepID=A0A5E4Y207_9BURK|nr:phosphoglycolate phosphatase [Pandoraea terrae]VVE42779.1 phosphoglycolate phosphatase [Pandoraea terrae]